MGLFDDLQGSAVSDGVQVGAVAPASDPARAARGASVVPADVVRSDPAVAVGPPADGIHPDAVTRSQGKKKKAKGGAVVLSASGTPADMLPSCLDDVPRLLPLWVARWCEENNVDDLRKVSPLVFGSLCQYIGGYIKESRILKDKTRSAVGACVASTCNRYDARAVAGLLDLFVNFCGACDKVPFASCFASFCGVSVMYIREYVQGLTSAGLNLAQKTHDLEMDSIRRKTSADPVGRLAILNNEYYGGGGAVSRSSDPVAVSLPASGSFGLIGCGSLD